MKRKEKRKNLSVGIQVEAVSRYKSELHITHDKVSNCCSTNISSKLLRKPLETQREWITHSIGDLNQDKTFVSIIYCIFLLLFIFLLTCSSVIFGLLLVDKVNFKLTSSLMNINWYKRRSNTFSVKPHESKDQMSHYKIPGALL